MSAKKHSYCAPTPPSGQCLECVREDLEAKLERMKDAYAISQNSLIEADLKMQELVEAAGQALEELARINPYDRRDVRFPSKAETRLRKAVEACAKKQPDEYCTDRSPGFVKGGTLTCSLKAGHSGQHQSTVDGMPCSWR